MTTTLGLILTFGCALTWVAADGLRKHITSQFDAAELGVCLHGLQTPFLAALLAVPWVFPDSEWSATAFSLEFRSGYWLPAMPSLLCNAVANVLFLRALQLSDLSLCVPYLSLTPVFAMLTGWLVVGESPTMLGITGVLIIGLGALVLNPGKSPNGRFQPIQTLLDEKGSLAMLGVAMLWSIAVAFDKAAVRESSPLAHAMMLAVSGTIILEMWRRRTPSHAFVARIRNGWRLVVVTAAIITAGMLLQLAAYAFIEVAYVEAIKRSMGLVGSVAVGWLFFRERNLSQRLFGVSVMAVGVCFILFASP